ncbi:heat-labile enterotoxin, A chain [Purpureocillium lilacinum]|uniref:Heat-labile enterotoxin, A chain n=1 Tax=Purpureocillium lilacinum TaxID=33203 RepID=A0A179HKB6_PURLI|nr:heat-labile enterotoxin, A chain [Purpureocillium lilacinum]OAQ89910.1 heat-labile enterotoxin, A chain [Purpureocillium lilacinum]
MAPAGGSPETAQQFGANRSAISLAMNIYKNLGTSAPSKTSAIPGDASQPGSPRSPPWTLQTMAMPATPVVEALIDVYFERLHWFIWIFHKPSFEEQARQILSMASWGREDMSKVLVTLTVAALGLKCALQDTSPYGQQLLASISPDPRGLMDQMIAELRLHLLDLLDDNCIETVQVTLLLGAFYIFHGSPSLAWATIGLSVRASYALALHCASETDDRVATQIRRRCWNHLTVADTFASQIYGRPGSLDSAFSDLLPLAEMDDTAIDLSSEPQIQGRVGVGDGTVTALTFHWLKYKLYEIIRKTLSTFRLLRLHNPLTAEELQSLIDAVHHIEGHLAEWRRTLPPLLSSDNLSRDFAQHCSTERLASHSHQSQNHDLRRVKLQACLLQITYDAAIILTHRPLLEHRLSSAYCQDVSKRFTDTVSRSFDVSVKAALRISKIPILDFKNEFCMAFIFIHLFTAGVILCIPPTSHPNSKTAQDAKAGVFRIIQAAKELRLHSQIARHTERLLSDLLKLSLHREVDMAFKEERRWLDQRPSSTRHSPDHSHMTSAPEDRVQPSRQSYLSQSGPEENAEANKETFIPSLLTPSSLDRTASLSQEDIGMRNLGDELDVQYSGFSNLGSADGCETEPLGLPLDEALGSFGQCKLHALMFNLMPDDPLNHWGWGKGTM